MERLTATALKREQADPEHPELEREPFDSVVSEDSGTFESLADDFRQIGYDERAHEEESLAWTANPRFA